MRLVPSLFVAALTGSTIVAIAQQNPQDPKSPQQPPADSRGADSRGARASSSSLDDGIFATWLLIENDNEVALATLAQERAEQPSVKEFAQKMVQDHRQLAQKLQPFAARAGYTGSSDSRGDKRSTGEGEPQNPKNPTQTPRSTEGREAGRDAAGGGIDHIALMQELGEQCLTSTREMLTQKSGAEFDRCYMGMMLGAHMKAKDQLIVFQRHVSGDLKALLADGQKTVESHLEHAKEIAMRLEKGSEGVQQRAQ